MTLAEEIARHRTECHWSQGELAEKMGVSRQSISKWETGNSTPELDKLIALSELFGVSIDALVKGQEQGEKSDNDEKLSESKDAPSKYPPRKIVGYILFGVGLLSMALGLFLNPLLAILGGYIFLCGIICITVKKHPGLVIAWGTFLPCVYFLPRATSANMRMIFQPYVYQNIGNWTVQLIVSYGFWVLLFLLIFITVRKTKMKRHPYLFFGWGIFLQIYDFIPIAFRYTEETGKYYIILSWCVIVFLVTLLFFTGKCVYNYFKTSQNRN